MAKTRTFANNKQGWILEIVNDNGNGHRTIRGRSWNEYSLSWTRFLRHDTGPPHVCIKSKNWKETLESNFFHYNSNLVIIQ